MGGGTVLPIHPCLFTLIALLVLFFQPCHLMNTIVIDGLAEWKEPTLHVQDSIVFEHIQNLYLFHNRKAFDLCVFARATLVYDGTSNFTWRPYRPGHYYFSTRVNGTGRSCEEGEKFPVRVITPDLSSPVSPPPLPAPTPTAGGDLLPTLPSHGWVSSNSPIPSPDASGIPFISSNPAVPIPTGETDTATIRPLPTPGDETQVVGLGSSHRIQLVLSVMISSLLWGLLFLFS